MRYFFFLSFLLLIINVFGIGNIKFLSSSDNLANCDSLTSQLCPLTETKGFMKIRNTTLAYYIFSQPNSSLLNKVPLIGINGGPGLSHHYMRNIRVLACKGTPVILYDQVGNGNSTRIESLDYYPWLLTVDYYVEELHKLINHLNLKEVFILGHSWGTVVAQEYGMRKPSQLKGLILSGALSDSQFYIKSQWIYNLGTFPHYTQELIKKIDKSGDHNGSQYQFINQILGFVFTTRNLDRFDCVESSSDNGNKDIYEQIQGPSEFAIGGVLEFWNVTSNITNINVDTLVTRGEYDTMTQEVSQKIVNQIPKARPLVTVERSGHMSMIDENDIYMNHVENFIQEVLKSESGNLNLQRK